MTDSDTDRPHFKLKNCINNIFFRVIENKNNRFFSVSQSYLNLL